MRKLVLFTVLASAMTFMSPAHAGLPAGTSCNDTNGCTITHTAPVPCTVACAYWPAATTAGFNECEAPFPEGSYDFTRMRLTSETGIVQISAKSPIDYDTFVCTDTNPPVLVANYSNTVGEDCEGLAGRNAVAVGCTESGSLTYNGLVAKNQGVNPYGFIIISYNWSDNGVLPVVVKGPAAVVNDNYEAACPAALCG